MIFEAYATRMQRRRAHPHSVMNFRRHVEVWTLWAATNSIDILNPTTTDLEDYFASLVGVYALSTLRSHLMSLRCAYRYAQRRGVVTKDPTVEVALPRVPDTEPRILPSAVLRSLGEGCRDAQDHALWALLTYTGMRRVEVRRLRWEDVNFVTTTIRVFGKQDKLRNVPLHPRLASVLRGLQYSLKAYIIPGRGGHQVTDGTFQYKLNRVLGQTAKCHDFRRTVASSLYRNGIQPDTIDRILGWAPREVRSRYYVNIADDQLQAAILRLYADDPL